MYQLESPPINQFFTVNAIKNCLKGSKNTVYINDENLQFQHSIGLIGTPILLQLDSKGTLVQIYQLDGNDKTLRKFYQYIARFVNKL